MARLRSKILIKSAVNHLILARCNSVVGSIVMFITRNYKWSVHGIVFAMFCQLLQMKNFCALRKKTTVLT